MAEVHGMCPKGILVLPLVPLECARRHSIPTVLTSSGFVDSSGLSCGLLDFRSIDPRFIPSSDCRRKK